MLADRAGEGTLLMSEEHTLDEVLWHRSGIYRDEGPISPVAELVEGTGEEFFPGPRLAFEEDCRPCRCDGRHSLEDSFEGGALSDQLPLAPELADLLPQLGILSSEPDELECLIDD